VSREKSAYARLSEENLHPEMELLLAGMPFESLTALNLSRSSRSRVKSRGGIEEVARPYSDL
jgi:hypothetical protein